ncbi:Acetamidase [Lobaria immixta]|nr:Acetamidase [Lobaria immixta]
MTPSAEIWQRLATSKRESINSAIPEAWRLSSIPSVEDQRDVTGEFIRKYLSKEEIEITEADAPQIISKTTTGQWKAETVVKAFCHRASIAHQLTNCLHEIFFDAALEGAKELDEHFAKYKAPVGPLHGLPVSLKDQFHVKDIETTMGYVGWIGTFQGKKGTGLEKVYESEMVRDLRKLGATLYCKTSVPHTLMAGETVNNIIGYTTNPRNRNLSSGGSSGGEGALIGLRGSPAGFGTDIGGSIRIPAAFNGLYGLRPSAGRLSYQGIATSMDGQNSVLSVVGPLAHSVATLRLMVKSLLTLEPWLRDPLVHEIPWRDDQERQILDHLSAKQNQTPKLAFGIMRHDGVANPQPPIQRALDIVESILKKLGHEVVDWKPPSHDRGCAICLKTYKYDGGADVHKALGLSGEPISPQVARIYGSEQFQAFSADEIAATNIAKREYQKEYMDYWNSTKDLTGTGRPVEAFIMPCAPFPAARIDAYHHLGYTTIVNALDYTACTIPVTSVDQDVDVVDKNYRPSNKVDKRVADDYDPSISHGTPVAVQLIGRRLQEEKVLILAEHISKALIDLT